jgi:hypothetical protein
MTTDEREGQLRRIRRSLESAAGLEPDEALPYLREAADQLSELIDESMAQAVLSGKASLRSAGMRAGLTENAVGPRLARTKALGAYADSKGRVTASAVERARFEQEIGAPRPAPDEPPPRPMRFRPRRPTTRGENPK